MEDDQTPHSKLPIYLNSNYAKVFFECHAELVSVPNQVREDPETSSG